MDTITIKDIAKICGVGVATVSRALNNHPDINPETRQKVLDVVEEYGFVPNNSARNLKKTDSRTIAILVKGMTNPFFMKMIGIMEEEIQVKRYSLELRHVDENTDEVEVALELVKEKKLRGIIFLGGLITHSTEKLEKIGIPFVLSTIPVSDGSEGSYSSVSVDDVAESRKIVDFLIKKGHKKIAFMGAPKSDISIGKLRYDGYIRALEDNKIKPDQKLIWHSEEDADTYSMQNGYDVMNSMLKKKMKFTALFAISDTMAIGALKALREAGIRVPEDVAVVGYDGIDMGTFCAPTLTTICQPFEEMARKTCSILFDVIRHDLAHQKIIMEAKIVERESTGNQEVSIG
ncbi:MAG: LacI family transcriptional regulator [Lachnospiraceae bacterium]|nr:LacI family transcriptional regulator [Lachnospiraceae bacterium]